MRGSNIQLAFLQRVEFSHVSFGATLSSCWGRMALIRAAKHMFLNKERLFSSSLSLNLLSFTQHNRKNHNIFLFSKGKEISIEAVNL